MKKATIKQIADIAKVSRGTVDKVLNNRRGVSDEVRKKVRKVAEDLGYTPNIIGKALACQNNPLVIAVIIPRNDLAREARRGFDAVYQELKDFGFKLNYYTINDFDVAEQLNVLEYLNKIKVSGVIVRPLEHQSVRDGINKLVDNNIPVITYNSDLKQCKRLCFVGQNPEKAGRVAGYLMGKLLNRRGRILVITGSNSLSSLNQRMEGFRRVIEQEYPNIEIAEVVETKEQEIVTFKKTLTLLDKVTDLEGVYIPGGCVNEVGRAVKLRKRSDLKIVSFDLFPEIVELVKEGIIDFTIGQDPFAQGYQPVKLLFNFLFKGEQPETDFIETAIDIRVKGNVD